MSCMIWTGIYLSQRMDEWVCWDYQACLWVRALPLLSSVLDLKENSLLFILYLLLDTIKGEGKTTSTGIWVVRNLVLVLCRLTTHFTSWAVRKSCKINQLLQKVQEGLYFLLSRCGFPKQTMFSAELSSIFRYATQPTTCRQYPDHQDN